MKRFDCSFRKHGQPIFEGRKLRRTNSLIDINQTLQLTKSKRIPVQRQTTFERVENDSSIEQTIQIKSLENPHRLALLLYSSPDQNSFLKHMNSTRTSSKVHQSLSDERSTLLHQHQFDFIHSIFHRLIHYLLENILKPISPLSISEQNKVFLSLSSP